MTTKKQDENDDNYNLTETHSLITTQFQLEQQNYIL
jgi:hypothetical protein